jgi:hypothetical protein
MPKSITRGPSRAQHDVGRLQVAVDDPGAVDGHQRLGQPGAQRQHGGHRQRPVLLDDPLQGHARQVGGGQPWLGRVRVGVHDRRGERAADRPHRARLPAEPLPEARVPGQMSVHDLDRDHEPARGAPQIHQAHAARSQPGQQPVPADAARVAGP